MNNIIFRATKKVIYKRTLIINLPFIGLNNPPMGPAIIQAIAKKNGIAADFVDLNLELQRALETHQLKHGIFYEWTADLRTDLTDEEQKF